MPSARLGIRGLDSLRQELRFGLAQRELRAARGGLRLSPAFSSAARIRFIGGSVGFRPLGHKLNRVQPIREFSITFGVDPGIRVPLARVFYQRFDRIIEGILRGAKGVLSVFKGLGARFRGFDQRGEALPIDVGKRDAVQVVFEDFEQGTNGQGYRAYICFHVQIEA